MHMKLGLNFIFNISDFICSLQHNKLISEIIFCLTGSSKDNLYSNLFRFSTMIDDGIMRHHKFLQQNCWHIFFHKKNWVLFELNLYLLTSAFSYLVIIILSLAENSLISLKWIHLCEERDSVLEQLADTILSDCEMNFQRYSHLIHLNRKRIHHRFERVIFCAWCSVYLNTKGWQYFASPTAEMFRDTFRHSHLNSKRISCWSLLCFWKGYFSVVTDISFSCLSLYWNC